MYSGKEGAFVLKMIRWHRQKKTMEAGIKELHPQSACWGMLVVCLGGFVGYRNKLKADEKASGDDKRSR